MKWKPLSYRCDLCEQILTAHVGAGERSHHRHQEVEYGHDDSFDRSNCRKRRRRGELRSIWHLIKMSSGVCGHVTNLLGQNLLMSHFCSFPADKGGKNHFVVIWAKLYWVWWENETWNTRVHLSVDVTCDPVVLLIGQFGFDLLQTCDQLWVLMSHRNIWIYCYLSPAVVLMFPLTWL